MAKNTKDKPVRPRALPAKGFRDYFGSAVIKRYDMLATIGKIYHRYGFAPLESSAVETVEALGKFLPDTDRPNDGVFAWQDEDDGWLALRYDLTAPLARVFAQHRNDLPLPYRRYAMGPVWRNEKIGAGRYRQFYQCDADTVGASSPAADAEICMMLADVLEAVGIARNDYQIRLNSRKILNGVLDSLGLMDAEVRGGVLRTIDKFDKIGESGVRSLLTKGRLDKSGAFIDGVGLSSVQADGVLAFLMAKGKTTDDTLNNIANIIGDLPEGVEGATGVVEVRSIIYLVRKQGYKSDRIVFDPSVVRGLGYYTGAVYEAELTFEIKDKKGRVRQFGSVAGGGRYDDLIKRFTGQLVPATGVSVGVDRLLAALEERAGEVDMGEVGPVIVTVMDKDRIGDYQAMVSELRGAGIRAELYLGNPKNFGNQLKYADMRGSPLAVIQGADERVEGIVQIKNLVEGAIMSKNIDNVLEWRKQPAQTSVKRADLAAEVEQILNESMTIEELLVQIRRENPAMASMLERVMKDNKSPTNKDTP